MAIGGLVCAGLVPVQGTAGWGGFQRKSPTGGAAKGTPRNERTPEAMTVPCKVPLATVTLASLEIPLATFAATAPLLSLHATDARVAHSMKMTNPTNFTVEYAEEPGLSSLLSFIFLYLPSLRCRILSCWTIWGTKLFLRPQPTYWEQLMFCAAVRDTLFLNLGAAIKLGRSLGCFVQSMSIRSAHFIRGETAGKSAATFTAPGKRSRRRRGGVHRLRIDRLSLQFDFLPWCPAQTTPAIRFRWFCPYPAFPSTSKSLRKILIQDQLQCNFLLVVSERPSALNHPSIRKIREINQFEGQQIVGAHSEILYDVS